MSKGVVLFAYNNPKLDYVKLSILAGKLANKYLKVPVSLITDSSTLAWAKESKVYDLLKETFENIIIDELENVNNYRILHDGSTQDKIPFKNNSRFRVWDLTPYDRTLLIDSDYLVFSDALSQYWNLDQDFLISPSIKDIHVKDRMAHNDRYISDVGITMKWATTIMFTKNKNSKVIFDHVKNIYENYTQYAEIYRYDSRIYRNDIAFSIACHTAAGFIPDQDYFLPPVLSTIDKDILYDVRDDGRLIFLIDKMQSTGYLPVSTKNLDMHVMNKQSIIRNYDSIMELL